MPSPLTRPQEEIRFDRRLALGLLLLLLPTLALQASLDEAWQAWPSLMITALLTASAALELGCLMLRGTSSPLRDALPLLSLAAVVTAAALHEPAAVHWLPVAMVYAFTRLDRPQALAACGLAGAAALGVMAWSPQVPASMAWRTLLVSLTTLWLLWMFFRTRSEIQDRLDRTRQLLDASLRALSQGVSVIGPDGRLKLHNAQMARMLDLPEEWLAVGPKLSEIVEFQRRRGDFGEGYALVRETGRDYVASGGVRVDDSVPRTYTRRTVDGRYLEVMTLPMPTGDVVRTYTDVTPYELVNQQLGALLADHEALRRRELDRSREQTIVALSQLSLHRDNETGRHILRTQLYLRTLAEAAAAAGYCSAQLAPEQIERMVKAAPMHDLGKIGIPDHILHKPGRHTPEEAEVMRTHAAIGESTLLTAAQGSGEQESVLRMAARIAGGHHEHWDGSGYPRGLKGEAIPLEARLMALADVYDALTTPRVYKRAWSHDEALTEILWLSGRKFDPQLVTAMMNCAPRFLEIAQTYRDEVDPGPASAGHVRTGPDRPQAEPSRDTGLGEAGVAAAVPG